MRKLPGIARLPLVSTESERPVELLVAADLPAGWWLPDAAPYDSGDLDRALRYEEWVDSAGLGRGLRTEHNNVDAGRWFLIQHQKSGTRVLLRLQPQQRMTDRVKGEVRIVGIVHLPYWAGDPVASFQLRELPTAKIEAAINKRLFAVTGASQFVDGWIMLPSGRRFASKDVLQPFGDPKRTPDFYELVALQHARLDGDGDPNPTATMARISDVALSTAQGWVARARKKGLIPPGRRGRAG